MVPDSIARIDDPHYYGVRFDIENLNYLENIAEAQTFDTKKRTKYDYVHFQGEVQEDNNKFATKLNKTRKLF